MLTIDSRQALDLLNQVVSRHGEDHIDPNSQGDGCRYVEDANALVLTALCIVGQVFGLLGILRALLRPEGSLSDQFGACESGSGLWTRAAEFGVTFTKDAQRLLRFVQARQDHGLPWGVAVRAGVLDFLSWQSREAHMDLGGAGWDTVKVTVEGKTGDDLAEEYRDSVEAALRAEAEAEALEDALSPVGTF